MSDKQNSFCLSLIITLILIPMQYRVCEICGLRERHKNEKLFFVRFPLDEQRCKEWLRIVGKQDLVHLPIEKLHQLRYICGKHFPRKDFTKNGKRLKKRAIPKLFLTQTPIGDDCFAEFPLHIANVAVIPSSSQDNTKTSNIQLKQTSKIEIQDLVMPCTSNTQPVSTALNIAKRRKVLVAVNIPNIVKPSTSSKQIVNQSTALLSTESEMKLKKTSKIEIQDLNTTEKNLLQELKRAKSTIKSLKKNARIIENIQSTLLIEAFYVYYLSLHKLF